MIDREYGFTEDHLQAEKRRQNAERWTLNYFLIDVWSAAKRARKKCVSITPHFSIAVIHSSPLTAAV